MRLACLQGAPALRTTYVLIVDDRRMIRMSGRLAWGLLAFLLCHPGATVSIPVLAAVQCSSNRVAY